MVKRHAEREAAESPESSPYRARIAAEPIANWATMSAAKCAGSGGDLCNAGRERPPVALRPVSHEHDLFLKPHAETLLHALLDRGSQAADIHCAGVSSVHDEVAVPPADLRPTNLKPLAAACGAQEAGRHYACLFHRRRKIRKLLCQLAVVHILEETSR